MLPWVRKHANVNKLVGLELQPEGIALVSKSQNGGDPLIDKIAFIAGENDAERFSQLRHYVHTEKLEDIGCNLVLPNSAYQLFLLEAPEVPEVELRDAIRWRMKDLVNMPMEKIALDIFLLPKDMGRAGKKMVYVAVVNRDYLLNVIDWVRGTGLVLKAIDIAELAMRNVVINLVDPQMDFRGVAVARIRRGAGTVSVFRGGNLYLSRQFDLAYGGGLLEELPAETLALELQRSLDYYERQLGQAAPSVLYVGGENIHDDKLTNVFRINLATPIQHLDFSGAVKVVATADAGLMQLCVAAAGAALRREFDS